MKAANYTFGGTAAIVTSVALIIGLDAATATKSTIVSGLLIVALADNLTDSLSMHIYQESERGLQRREAFRTTLSNYLTRLLIALTFILLVVILPIATAAVVSAIWGLLLLVALTWVLTREQNVSFVVEVVKHLTAAIAVVLVSKGIGLFINAHFGI